MNAFSRVLRSNLLLVIALVSSLLLLIIGGYLIYTAPDAAIAPAAQPATSDNMDFDIPPLPEVDSNPPADLSSVQAALNEMSKGVVPTGQEFSPEVIAEALATEEAGSETWCDIMLLKPDADWTETESQQFAQHCI